MVVDRRLAPAHAALEAGRIRVLSVDVFDTLLWRRVPEPTDVFLLLGRSLKAAGHLADHVSEVEFAELRRSAEMAARERKQAATGYREVTLVDIHTELPAFAFAPGFTVSMGAKAEFDLEQTLMIGDHGIVRLMQQAKAAGVRVILVSDTYFTSEQVKAFVAKPGAVEGREFDRLYVSCEAGRPKWRDLFDTVLKDMAVEPAAMLHIGDSLEADVWPCRTRGIDFVHYDKWSFGPRVQTQEFPRALSDRAALLGAQGDFGLTGFRSRLANRVPEDIDQKLAAYWTYGAVMLAPVFAGFARWMVDVCQREGVTRIYGMMREGRFLNRLVSETAGVLGVTLATEELWVSRRAVIRALLGPETPGLLPEVAMLSPGRSTEDVLAELGLTTADLAAAGMPAFDVTSADALQSLCRTIGVTPHLMAKVLAVSAVHRRNLMTGLERVLDINSAGPAVVMDLGYSATIQTALRGVLMSEGKPLQLIGLYLALNSKARENMRGGTDMRGYFNADGFGGFMGELLSRVPFVLEHACMCREGTLSHYDADGQPVLLANQRDDDQLAQMEAVQAGISAGVASLNRVLGDFTQTPANDPHLKKQLANMVTATHLYPTTQDAATIGAWRHEAKIDFTGAHKLTDLSFDGPHLEYKGWPALKDMGLDQVYWPSAAFAAADPFIADVYAAGLTDSYRGTHLTSGTMLGRIMVCPDLGSGFDERRQGGIPITANAFGRAEMQAAIKAPGADVYHRLRLTWPAARAVVAIETMTVTFVGDQQRLSRDVVDASHPITVWIGGRDTDAGVVHLDPGASCMVELGAAPPWPHALELKLRVKYLRLDALFGGRA